MSSQCFKKMRESELKFYKNEQFILTIEFLDLLKHFPELNIHLSLLMKIMNSLQIV
jgi:hypothetical protein